MSILATQLHPSNAASLQSSGVLPALRRDFSVRNTVHSSHKCGNCLKSIPQRIGDFISQPIVNVGMFVKAVISARHIYANDIDVRIDRITRFRDSANHLDVNQQFNTLDPSIQRLFFRVNREFIQKMTRETNRANFQRMQTIINSECNRAISYQNKLRFFIARNLTTIPSPSPNPVEIPTPRPHPRSFFNRRAPVRTPTHTEANPTPRVNLSIPGAIPYVQDHIPDDIQQKGREIARLKTLIANHALFYIPQRFRNTAIYANASDILSIMEIPVFDASHPFIQATLSLSYPHRHHMDVASFEDNMDRRGYCPELGCIHPSPASINRDHVMLDSFLQDEILTFLRDQNAALAARPTTRPTWFTNLENLRRRIPIPAASPTIVRSTLQHVPESVPYNPTNIPEAIQHRAENIASLQAQYETLSATNPSLPSVPDEFEDAVSADSIKTPVFDESHPSVQNALNNREVRHILDKSTFDGLRTSDCPTCRHPLARSHMYIDVAFQTEIETWYKTTLTAAGQTPNLVHP